MQSFRPVWIPLVLGYITSTLPVLNSAGHSARVASVYDTMRRVIDHVQALAGRRIRVLFLFPGVDGLTTNNESWQYLVDRFPEVLFSLTAIVSPQLGVLYPSVFTKIERYAWTHIDVEELYSPHSEMLRGFDTATLFLQSPKPTRFVSWLTALHESSSNSSCFRLLQRLRSANSLSQ